MKQTSDSYQSLPTNDQESCEPVEVEPVTVQSKWKKTIIEFLFAFGISISWACGRQFTKSALNLNPNHFYAPYFLVWFNTCFMLVCFPVFVLYNFIFNQQSARASFKNSCKIFGAEHFTLRLCFSRVIWFIVLWIIANYSYSQALGYISASSALVIVSSNVAIICVLEWILLKEKLSTLKIISTILALTGVIILSLDEEFGSSPIGIGLVILCAFAAAIYKVLFKQVNGNADLGQTSLFMSALGAINLFVNAIPTIVLIGLGWDRIEWSFIPWLPLCMAAILSLTFNFLTNFGIALLGPFSVSIGTLFGIPISAAIDVLFRDMQITLKFIIGSVAIAASFIAITLPISNIYSKMRKRVNTET